MIAPLFKNVLALEQYFADLRRSEDLPDSISMDCLCLVASGMQNASMTLGWGDESEAFHSLAIRSIECLLSEESAAVKAEFLKLGLSN